MKESSKVRHPVHPNSRDVRNLSVKRMREQRRERVRAMRAAFVKMLNDAPVKDVIFQKGMRKITIEYLGRKHSYEIVVKKDVYVGSWSRKREDICVDRHLFTRARMKSFKAVCVHEAVESFISEKYGLSSDKEPHDVATLKEMQYLKKIGGNWRSHQLIVYHLWESMDSH